MVDFDTTETNILYHGDEEIKNYDFVNQPEINLYVENITKKNGKDNSLYFTIVCKIGNKQITRLLSGKLPKDMGTFFRENGIKNDTDMYSKINHSTISAKLYLQQNQDKSYKKNKNNGRIFVSFSPMRIINTTPNNPTPTYPQTTLTNPVIEYNTQPQQQPQNKIVAPSNIQLIHCDKCNNEIIKSKFNSHVASGCQIF
jgi:hypothetical protein